MTGCLKCGDEVIGDGSEDKDWLEICDHCQESDDDNPPCFEDDINYAQCVDCGYAILIADADKHVCPPYRAP